MPMKVILSSEEWKKMFHRMFYESLKLDKLDDLADQGIPWEILKPTYAKVMENRERYKRVYDMSISAKYLDEELEEFEKEIEAWKKGKSLNQEYDAEEIGEEIRKKLLIENVARFA